MDLFKKAKEQDKWIEEKFPGLEIDELWSISKDTAFFLYHFIIKVRPENILEFGSGVSSYVMAKAAQEYGGKIFSLEHNHDYFKKSKELCRCFDNHTIIHAPLVKHTSYEVHNPEKIPQKRFDFVFIDAPLGFLPEHPGRRGTLYACQKFINTSADIFLDDAERTGEREAVIEWMSVFGDTLSVKYLAFRKPIFWMKYDKSIRHHSIF